MSTASLCLGCLRRSGHRAAFSTSSSLSAVGRPSATPPKKKGAAARPAARQGRTLRLTKNTRASTTRPPAVGERKALRKRVVLANTNALEVPDLRDLSRESISSKALRSAQGRVLGLRDDTVETLRTLEAFKPTQGWSLFRRPATLITGDTATLATDLEWVAQGTKEGRTVRKVLCGERGTGKSVLQLQALAMASLDKWLVIHIPEAKDLTNAQTSYQPISTPDGILYIQPHYTAKLLESLGKANQALLSGLRLTKRHDLPVSIQPDASLTRLAELGAKDSNIAWPVWQALWGELLAPSTSDSQGLERPPLMFALDGIDHVMRLSAYLNADARPIHAHDLALVRHFVGLLSGRISLTNGGMILGAVSESNRAQARTLDASLARRLATQTRKRPISWDPYVAYDQRVRDAIETVSVQELVGLSKEETRGIMEYYARSGIMRSTVTDGLVSESWTLAGGGVIGQIEKGTVRARF